MKRRKDLGPPPARLEKFIHVGWTPKNKKVAKRRLAKFERSRKETAEWSSQL